MDAYGGQHSGGHTRSITTVFSLIGLYLAITHGYTGRQVQQAHMELAKHKNAIHWPERDLPTQVGSLTVMDVLLCDTDEERNEMLSNWASTVWQSWQESHEWVRETVYRFLKIHQ